MNSKERLQRAIAGRPTDQPVVAPAYLSLYLDATSQRLYREAYERKLFAEAGGLRSGAVRIDPVEDARFRADAILRAYEILGELPDWIHTHPAETRAWAERGEMRFAEGCWLYVDRQRVELLRGQAAAGVQYLWLEECLSSADLISPEDYERFAFATAGPYIAEARRLGLVEVIKIASAFVTKTGSMCSPQMLERLETRYQRQQVQMAKQGGRLVFHTYRRQHHANDPGFYRDGN